LVGAYVLFSRVSRLYPISVVLDNLNTHTPAALSETFTPAEARRMLQKLDFRDTPQHGSWLNMAEIEFAVLPPQGLDRRIPDPATVRRRLGAWEACRGMGHV